MPNTRLQALISRLALLAVAAVLVTVDRLSKSWVLANMQFGERRMIAPWIDPFINMVYTSNTGTAFGMLQGANPVFTGIAMLVTAAILFYAYRLPARERAMHLVLGVLLGGALGNLLDRLTIGHVVDFLHFNFWPLQDFPIFNAADASISGGVVLLALLVWWEERRASLSAPFGDADRMQTPPAPVADQPAPEAGPAASDDQS
jgi:signal peptidase II